LMPARGSMLLKSRASQTYFRAYFLPGQAKDLSAPGLFKIQISGVSFISLFKCLIYVQSRYNISTSTHFHYCTSI
jgi:hypothetical protein